MMGGHVSTAVCLLAALHGNQSALVLPSSANYSSSVPVYNLDIPISPAAVTYPSTAEEVAGIVKCAAKANLKVQAKGGGHSYGNYGWGGADGEVVVNLVNFNGFSYDASTTKAKIGGGNRLGGVTTALHNAGNRSVSHGLCPDVGIGGHATIGGLGLTSRLYGATVDHVEAVEIVLANGTIATASATENPDLLFAVKGAGGSFGIVTEFTFRTEPEPTEAVQFQFIFIGTNTTLRAQTFSEWQAYIANPDLPREFIVAMTVKSNAMVVTGTYLGSLSAYNALNVRSAFTATPAIANVTVINDWLTLSEVNGQQPKSLEEPSFFYAKSLGIKPTNVMSDETILAFFTYADTQISDATETLFIFYLVGGAANDVAADAAAFPHRDVLYWMFVHASTNGTVTSTTVDYLDGLNNVIETANPSVSFGAYAGYVDPRLANAPGQYWGQNLARLESIKRAVDPWDVFHNPQSVPACS